MSRLSMATTIRDRHRLGQRDGRKAGFTLVEMLVVLAIIGLIVGIAAPRVFNQLAGAKVRAAKVQIESLKSALDLFFLDVGRYPTVSEGLGALIARPSNSAIWNGPYIKSAAVPHDPWNHEYIYHSPGRDGRPYDIVSLGADGRDGGADNAADVTSW
uniref:Type II secretion system core protein G n=1 Tax=Rhodopseudomonas palustris (strain BisA53) TaxID=316055 RepID=Q07N86_RHOP5